MSIFQEMSKDITFEEEGHVYYYGTIKLPCVSDIIKPLYNFDGIKADVLQYAADRGTDVHFAIEKYVKYGWTSKLDTDAQPYFEQFLLFMKDKDREMYECEVIGRHKAYNYCGTMDLISPEELIDIKTSAVPDIKTWSVQLTGYALIAKSYGIILKSIKILHLSATGYKLYDIKLEEGVFVACLAVYNYKMKGE